MVQELRRGFRSTTHRIHLPFGGLIGPFGGVRLQGRCAVCLFLRSVKWTSFGRRSTRTTRDAPRRGGPSENGHRSWFIHAAAVHHHHCFSRHLVVHSRTNEGRWTKTSTLCQTWFGPTRVAAFSTYHAVFFDQTVAAPLFPPPSGFNGTFEASGRGESRASRAARRASVGSRAQHEHVHPSFSRPFSSGSNLG